jgi:hypothetical protein
MDFRVVDPVERGTEKTGCFVHGCICACTCVYLNREIKLFLNFLFFFTGTVPTVIKTRHRWTDKISI